MKKRLAISLLAAALLWFYMFSPWTAGLTNFWLNMSCAALVLASLALTSGTVPGLRDNSPSLPVQILAGVVIAFALWGVFWVGDKLSQLLFDFARNQVDGVYSLKTGLPKWGLALLLLTVIGPAEELFWRGYVQASFQRILSPDLAFIVTLAAYALVHIWSFNFMLVMAALVAGGVWGLVYRFKPSLLPALVISHSFWDALIFVIIPV